MRDEYEGLSPSFAEQCRIADERVRRKVPAPQRRRPTPRSTIDALVYELRTDGMAALQRPHCLGRLSDVSPDDLRGVIASLIQLRSKYPSITDALLLKLGGLL